MSIMLKLRSLLGQRLLQNTAGYRVVRASHGSGPWVSEGEALALVPEGIQEVQFPVEVMGADSIMALVQVSVIFSYTNVAEDNFNFAYDVVASRHTGNYADTVKKAIMNVIAPRVVKVCAGFPIVEMIKQTALLITEEAVAQSGVDVTSVQLSVRPRDANVLASLGATKTEELQRVANTARQETRMQAVEEAAELRVAEHEQSMESVKEAELLIAERAKNQLAEAEAMAESQSVLAIQKAEELSEMVASFGGDPMAYALSQLANSGGNVTVTTEFLSAIRAGK